MLYREMSGATGLIVKTLFRSLIFIGALPVLSLSLAQSGLAQSATGQSDSTGNSSAMRSAPNESSSAAAKPLAVQSNEGFWGHLNPFARKKWVKRQLDPVNGRLNELDELTGQQAKDIKSVDERAQAGIHRAQDTADQANQQAASASASAASAQSLANQSGIRTQQLGTTVANLDQYQVVSDTEIRFRPGQVALNEKAKDALGGLASQLQGGRGYLVEVQGYSRGKGQASVQTSQRLADSVVRYLVEQQQVPVYRIHVLGMGNAALKDSNGGATSGNSVHVTLVQNSLAALNSPGTTGGSPIGGNQQAPRSTPSAQQ